MSEQSHSVMTLEIFETKEEELELLDDTIEGLELLLKQKKEERERLRRELTESEPDLSYLP